MKRIRTIIHVAIGVALLFFCSGAAPASAEDASLRSKRWEILLGPQYTLARNLGFDGGTTAKINDTWGFAFQIGYNFNAHWNLAGIFSWSQPDYQAVVQPAAGTLGGPRSISGSIQTNTFGLNLTYNILKGPLTPYVEGNVSGTYINTDIAAGPPVVGCYWDPWFGQICGVTQPTKSDTYFSTGIGGGLRWDINKYVLLRGGVRYQWIDLSNTGVPGFTIFKIDIGFKF
jgi:opacity protein-like surface antigen